MEFIYSGEIKEGGFSFSRN